MDVEFFYGLLHVLSDADYYDGLVFAMTAVMQF